MATPAIPPGFKLVPDEQGGPPEGRGRAMAMQTYLARGGGMVKNRKGVEVYADGPMRGMTQSQAEADFERKWAGASGRVRDKYAAKARDILSPSEKTALTPAMPKDMSPAAVQKRRMAQYGHEFAPDGSVRRIGTPERKPVNPAATPAMPAAGARTNRLQGAEVPTVGRNSPLAVKPGGVVGDEKYTNMTPPPEQEAAIRNSTINPAATPDGSADQPIGTPEERAKVSQMMAEGENFATASVGAAMGMRSALALDAKRGDYDPDLVAPRAEAKDRDAAAEKAKMDAASAMAAEMRTKNAADKVAAERQKLGLDPASPQASSALETQFPGIESGKPTGIPSAPMVPGQNPIDRQFPGIESGKPTGAPIAPSPRVTPSITPTPPSPMIMRPEVRSREMVPPTLRRPDDATDGSPVVARPADVNGQRMDPAIPGAAGNKVRINSLTGLPFGYNPGDALPASADAAMQQRGRDSQTRQSVAAAGAPPPRATVVTPAPRPTALQQSAINRPRTVTTGVEGAANREMKRQAGINANPSTVNPDDPRKFFTGRTLPLDQLVKRQTVSTPARR